MAVIELRSSFPSPAVIELGFGIICIVLLDEFIFWTQELQLKNKRIIHGNVLILLIHKVFKALKYLLFKIFFTKSDQGNEFVYNIGRQQAGHVCRIITRHDFNHIKPNKINTSQTTHK